MRLRRLLITASFLTTAFLPVFGAKALAQTACDNVDNICELQAQCFRDLGVNKEVKVPGGSFVEAHTSGAAPNATVGDTVEWKVTVTDLSTGVNNDTCLDVGGSLAKIVLKDALPAGFTYQSSTTDSGIYDQSTNQWTFMNSDFSSVDQISLTIVTTAGPATGTFENVVELDHLLFRGEGSDTFTRPYALQEDDSYAAIKDQNTQNDSSNAWVNIQVKPQVLGESTTHVLGLTDTGSSTVAPTAMALLLVGFTIAVAIASRQSRKYSVK